MLFPPRLRGKRLADLCHRLAICDESGIDVRRTWTREAENARGGARHTLLLVRDSIASGGGLADSLKATGGFFPPLLLEMVAVGEEAGGLSTVYHRLSRHYQRAHELAQEFRGRLAWPLFQLGAALGVVGLMLWFFSQLEVEDLDGQPIDLLGLGAGSGGFANYLLTILVAALAVSLLVVSVRYELAWTRPLRAMAIRLPGVGPCLEKICLARIAWVLHLTLNVAMDLRRIVPLAMDAARHPRYAGSAGRITNQIERGRSMHEAFASAGVFPVDFLDAVQVAEESGQLVESMGRLSEHYDRESESAMRTLGTIFSFAIWGGVTLIVGLMIFKLFSCYVGLLNNAANL